jgi:cell wall assembly regulator SMI1
MTTTEDAVRAIRHVVQDHGDEGTRLGEPADSKAFLWFGQLLGWEWPPSYVEVLARHDGVTVQDAIVSRFVESIEAFLILHESWHHPAGYWPVATDGCGNYFALSFGHRDSNGECPVVFFEMSANDEQPESTVAASYAEFVQTQMGHQCKRLGCNITKAK